MSHEKVRLQATFCDIASDGVEQGVDVEEGTGELDVLLALVRERQLGLRPMADEGKVGVPAVHPT